MVNFSIPMTDGQAGRIVNILADRPYREVADLVALIDGHAAAAVMSAQQRAVLAEAARLAPPAPVEAAPPPKESE